MSHSRIRRCEILLEFLRECLRCGKADAAVTDPAAIENMVQESLTFDLYYRENCKSRPAWAPNPGDFKRMTHTYCKNGKMAHIEPFHYVFPEKNRTKIDRLPTYRTEPVWVLFHYDMRDPLDHQAYVEYVES